MVNFIFFPFSIALVAVVAQVIHDTVSIRPTELLTTAVKRDPVLEAKLERALRTFDQPVWWRGVV